MSKVVLTEQDKKDVLDTNAVIKLATVMQIIKTLDVSSRRGAFQGNELSSIGALYDTLNKGLNTAFEDKLKEKTKEQNSHKTKTVNLETINE